MFVDGSLPAAAGAGAGNTGKSGHGEGAAPRAGPLMAYSSRPELLVVVMAAPAPVAFSLGRA